MVINYYNIHSDDPIKYNSKIVRNVKLRSISNSNMHSAFLFSGTKLCVPDEMVSCIFIHANGLLPIKQLRLNYLPDKNLYETIISTISNGNTIIAELIDMSEEIQERVHNSYPEAKVFCCSRRNGFCIVLPSILYDAHIEDVRVDILKIVSRFKFEHDSIEDLNLISEQKKAVSSIHDNIQSVKYNPHFDGYKFIVSKLLNINTCVDKQYEYLLLASLVQKNLYNESVQRWIYSSGDIHYEDNNISEYFDERYQNFFKNIERFIEQTDENDARSDWLWSILFISQILLESLHSENSEKNRDFYGFFPIMAPFATEQLTSFYTQHYSPTHNAGFLYIPKKYVYSFWKMFPAYVHELFHYIPPVNRVDRNRAIQELVIYTVLNPMCTAFFNEYKEDSLELKRKIYKILVDKIKKNISELYELFSECANNAYDSDSMDFLDRTREFIYSINFEEIFVRSCTELGYETGYDKYIGFILGMKNTCIERFNDFAVGYFNIFTMAMREIRSDIMMCQLLKIDLKGYIDILSNEKNFSKFKSDNMGDSTILRFGFMTRYLYYLKHMTISLQSWKEECDHIFSTLIEYYYDDMEKIERIDNLRDYIRAYCRITIQEKDGFFVQKGFALFENIINGTCYQLIKCWEKEKDKYMQSEFLGCLIKIYQEYLKSSDEQKSIIEKQTSIIFSDIFRYFPNIGDETSR